MRRLYVKVAFETVPVLRRCIKESQNYQLHLICCKSRHLCPCLDLQSLSTRAKCRHILHECTLWQWTYLYTVPFFFSLMFNIGKQTDPAMSTPPYLFNTWQVINKGCAWVYVKCEHCWHLANVWGVPLSGSKQYDRKWVWTWMSLGAFQSGQLGAWMSTDSVHLHSYLSA